MVLPQAGIPMAQALKNVMGQKMEFWFAVKFSRSQIIFATAKKEFGVVL